MPLNDLNDAFVDLKTIVQNLTWWRLEVKLYALNNIKYQHWARREMWLDSFILCIVDRDKYVL